RQRQGQTGEGDDRAAMSELHCHYSASALTPGPEAAAGTRIGSDGLPDQWPTIVKLMFTTSFTETTPPTLTGFIPYSDCLTGKRPVAVSVRPSIRTLTGTVISWATPRIVSWPVTVTSNVASV